MNTRINLLDKGIFLEIITIIEWSPEENYFE